jgi:small subunit ribosomal protein S21
LLRSKLTFADKAVIGYNLSICTTALPDETVMPYTSRRANAPNDIKRVLREGVIPISVELRPGESQESILKRFRKAVAEARILPIVRQKRWFTPRSEVKRIKRQKAIRKAQRMSRQIE